MKSQNLFTSGENPKAIDDRDVYLMLITRELCSHHNAHSVKQKYSIPDRIVRDYMKNQKKDRDILHYALRKLDGYNSETFTESLNKKLREKYKEEKEKTLEELLAFSYEVLSGRSNRISFNVVANNHIKSNPLKALLKKNEVNGEVELLSVPSSVLNDVDRKINKYSKSDAKLRALEYVEDHIALKEKYKFRKLVDNSGQIFDLMFTEGKYSDVDPASALNNLKKYVIEAVNSYEVFDNIDFLIDSDSYYQTLYTGFKNKLENNSPN